MIGVIMENSNQNFTHLLRTQLHEGVISPEEFREAWDSWVIHNIGEVAIREESLGEHPELPPFWD